MKFASFNLFQYVAPDYYWYKREPRASYTEAEWIQKQAWISQRLNLMAADVIGFQEVFSFAALQALCGQTAQLSYLSTPHKRPVNLPLSLMGITAGLKALR